MLNLKDLTLKEKIGQMIGLAFSGSEYSKELQMQMNQVLKKQCKISVLRLKKLEKH